MLMHVDIPGKHTAAPDAVLVQLHKGDDEKVPGNAMRMLSRASSGTANRTSSALTGWSRE
jgi:hypothetical protein